LDIPPILHLNVDPAVSGNRLKATAHLCGLRHRQASSFFREKTAEKINYLLWNACRGAATSEAVARASHPTQGPGINCDNTCMNFRCFQQATVDWLTADMGHFSTKKRHFGDLEASFWVPGVTILAIQRANGPPNRHLEVQVCIFVNFRGIGGPSGTHFGHIFVTFL